MGLRCFCLLLHFSKLFSFYNDMAAEHAIRCKHIPWTCSSLCGPVCCLGGGMVLGGQFTTPSEEFWCRTPSESWKVKHLKRWLVSKCSTLFFGEDSHFDAYCSNVLETTTFFTWSLGFLKWSIALMFYRWVGPVLCSPQLCQVPRIASKSTIEMGLGMWIGMPKEPPTSDVYLQKGCIHPSTLYYR